MIVFDIRILMFYKESVIKYTVCDYDDFKVLNPE